MNAPQRAAIETCGLALDRPRHFAYLDQDQDGFQFSLE